MSIHKKLTAARIQLQNTQLKKSGKNSYANYQYFELGDFLPAINNIFNEIGLCGVVSFTAELATLTITDVEDGKEIFITSPMADAPMKGTLPIQCLGAVETYNRRYLWMAAMEIVEHDAVDASEPLKEQPKQTKPSPAPNLQPPPLSESEQSDCIKFMNECTDLESLKGVFGAAYKRANEQQKSIIQDVYNAKKNLIISDGDN